jgi:ubiquinone/menaquinone biosynthesis C-methylase UbiE
MSSRPASSRTFARLAERYDELRPLDEPALETLERLVEIGDLRGRRVLDIGCGTGRFAIALAERYAAKVWGVDPEPAMLDVARRKAPQLGWKLGRAESLPFRDAWFGGAVLNLVLQHVERTAAFGEVQRVLTAGGRVVISTPDPHGIADHWFSRLFPSYLEIELERFPSAETIEHELERAGFVETRVERFQVERRLTRAFTLERIRSRSFSTFDLLPAAEYEAGLARAERELPETVEHTSSWLLVAGTSPR